MRFGAEGVVFSYSTIQQFNLPSRKFRKIEMLHDEVPEDDASCV
jgi:hypothetical protein